MSLKEFDFAMLEAHQGVLVGEFSETSYTSKVYGRCGFGAGCGGGGGQCGFGAGCSGGGGQCGFGAGCSGGGGRCGFGAGCSGE